MEFTFPYQKSVFQNNIYQAVTQKLSEKNNNIYQNNDNNIQSVLVEPENPTNNQTKTENLTEQKQLKVHHKQVKNNLNITESAIVDEWPEPVVAAKNGPTITVNYSSSEIALKFKAQLNEIGKPIEEKLYDTLHHISIEDVFYSSQWTNHDDDDAAEEAAQFDTNLIAEAKLQKILDMLENDSCDETSLAYSPHQRATSVRHCFAITIVMYFFGGFEWLLEVAKRFFDNLTMTIWHLLKLEQNCVMAIFCVFLFLCLIIIDGFVRCFYYMNKCFIRPIYDKYVIDKYGI